MKNVLFLLFSFGSIFWGAGCTHSVHIVNFSDQRPYGSSGQPVKAHAEQFVIMQFAFDTAYVDEAYRKLIRQCANGNVTAIATKYYTDHGFLSWTNHIDMTGTCVN